MIWIQNQPNNERVELDFSGLSKPIIIEGSSYHLSAIDHEGEILLPLRFIQHYIDPTIHFDAQSETVSVINTSIHEQVHAEQPFSLHFKAEKVQDEIYFPMQLITRLYDVVIDESDETGAVIVRQTGDIVQWGTVKTSAEKESFVSLRTGNDIKAPILYELSDGTAVEILEETDNGWYRILLSNGYTGYVEKANIQLKEAELVQKIKEQTIVPLQLTGGKINMTWDPIYGSDSDKQYTGEMPGVNVVSPSWFRLNDGEGNLSNSANLSYVQWAHGKGYQIWALFNNDFDPDKTSQALASQQSRANMINQLLAYAKIYQLQGINIDFENVYLNDKDLLTQFVQELTTRLHEEDLIVSIDVTVRGGSEMWSLFYDRNKLAKIVDYMIVMAYDEHWASSPVAGSVSSLPWAEKGIADIISKDDVPPSKLILGVPFYTRLWTERLENGKLLVSSQTMYMQDVDQVLEEQKLTPVFSEEDGQHYVQYQDGDTIKKIWIEDETSMKARVHLVHEYQLAGIASWRRGFEKPEIWDVIQKTLEQN